MAWAVCINNTFGERRKCLSNKILLTGPVAGILSLTFPRMQTVMTPTGACKFILGLCCAVSWTASLTLSQSVSTLD